MNSSAVCVRENRIFLEYCSCRAQPPDLQPKSLSWWVHGWVHNFSRAHFVPEEPSDTCWSGRSGETAACVDEFFRPTKIQINRHLSVEIMLPDPFSTRLKPVRWWCLWRNSTSACVSLTVVVEVEPLLECASWSSAGPRGLAAVHFYILKQYFLQGWQRSHCIYYVSMCYRAMHQDSTLRLKVFWRTYLCLKSSWRPRKYLAGFTKMHQKSRFGVQHDQMVFYEDKCLVLDINTSRRRKNSHLSMHFLRISNFPGGEICQSLVHDPQTTRESTSEPITQRRGTREEPEKPPRVTEMNLELGHSHAQQ